MTLPKSRNTGQNPPWDLVDIPRNGDEIRPMKAVMAVLVLLGLAVVPVAPAAVTSAAAAAAAETCAAKCCKTESDCCATSCPCPVSCKVPTVVLPLVPSPTTIILFSPADRQSMPVAAEEAAVRSTRPPVPPPRA